MSLTHTISGSNKIMHHYLIHVPYFTHPVSNWNNILQHQKTWLTVYHTLGTWIIMQHYMPIPTYVPHFAPTISAQITFFKITSHDSHTLHRQFLALILPCNITCHDLHTYHTLYTLSPVQITLCTITWHFGMCQLKFHFAFLTWLLCVPYLTNPVSSLYKTMQLYMTWHAYMPHFTISSSNNILHYTLRIQFIA